MFVFCTRTQPPNIWNACVGKLDDKKIITLQMRAIRSNNKVLYRSHTEPLFKSNQILKCEDMYSMQVSLLSMILTMTCYPDHLEMYFLKTALQDMA